MGVKVIADLLRSIEQFLGIQDNPAVVAAIIGVLGVLLFPSVVASQRRSRARRLLMRAGTTTIPSEREAYEAEALAEVASDPSGLILVAENALSRGRLALAKRVLGTLEATGKEPAELRRLLRQLEPNAPMSALEAVVRIRQFLEIGADEAARGVSESAGRRWPADPDLGELTALLAARSVVVPDAVPSPPPTTVVVSGPAPESRI